MTPGLVANTSASIMHASEGTSKAIASHYDDRTSPFFPGWPVIPCKYETDVSVCGDSAGNERGGTGDIVAALGTLPARRSSHILPFLLLGPI